GERGPGGTRRELSDEPPRDAGREQRLAARHLADGAYQVGRLGVLDEEPARARAQRLEDVLVQLEGGEDEDLDAGQRLVAGDPTRRLQPVDTGHADVHQHYVRAE